jgi:hypothetical protein
LRAVATPTGTDGRWRSGFTPVFLRQKTNAAIATATIATIHRTFARRRGGLGGGSNKGVFGGGSSFGMIISSELLSLRLQGND